MQGYSPTAEATAGAIVTVDRNEQAIIHRGLPHEAGAKALHTLECLRQGFSSEDARDDDEGEDGGSEGQPMTTAMSDKLTQWLSAHHTTALRIEVARHP